MVQHNPEKNKFDFYNVSLRKFIRLSAILPPMLKSTNFINTTTKVIKTYNNYLKTQRTQRL